MTTNSSSRKNASAPATEPIGRAFVTVRAGHLYVQTTSYPARCLAEIDLADATTAAGAEAATERLVDVIREHGIETASCSSSVDFPEDDGAPGVNVSAIVDAAFDRAGDDPEPVGTVAEIEIGDDDEPISDGEPETPFERALDALVEGRAGSRDEVRKLAIAVLAAHDAEVGALRQRIDELVADHSSLRSAVVRLTHERDKAHREAAEVAASSGYKYLIDRVAKCD